MKRGFVPAAAIGVSGCAARKQIVTGEARGARRLPGPFSFPSWPTRRREATVETISAAADRTPRRRATVEETA